jgi:hypothetical protein
MFQLPGAIKEGWRRSSFGKKIRVQHDFHAGIIVIPYLVFTHPLRTINVFFKDGWFVRDRNRWRGIV